MQSLIESLLRQGPRVVMFIIILVTGMRGIWKWGSDYDEMRRDRDMYRQLALRGVGAAEKGADTAEQLAGQLAAKFAKDAQDVIEAARKRGDIQ